LLGSSDMSLYLSGRCIGLRRHTTFMAFYSEVTILSQRVLKQLINTVKIYFAASDNIFNSVQPRFSPLFLPAVTVTMELEFEEALIGHDT